MSERRVLSEVLREVGSIPGVRLFRNQVGVGWVGRHFRLNPTTVQIMNAQRVTMGLIPGSGDLIGWRSVVIMPQDVGLTFAQFLSVEVKDVGGGVVSDEQTRWYENVSKAGGLAVITSDAKECRSILHP